MSLIEKDNMKLAPNGADCEARIDDSQGIVTGKSITKDSRSEKSEDEKINKLVIEHVTATTPENNEKSYPAQSNCLPAARTARFVGFTTSPYIVPCLAVYALFTTISSSFLLDGFLTIPGLNSIQQKLREQVANLTEQNKYLESNVDDLTEQVHLLEGEVDRLENNVDDYEILNQYLTGNITEVSRLNQELNTTVDAMFILNQQLNSSNQIYQELNQNLTENLNEFEILNANLSSTVDRLDSEINVVENVNANLTLNLYRSQTLNQEFAEQVNTLEETNLSLNRSIFNLSDTVSDLANQTSIMKEEIDELTSVLLFLNNTAEDIDQTFDATIAFLDTLIVKFQETVLTDTERFWETMVFQWRCDLDSAFGSKTFTQDTTIPIGNFYNEVMDYLDEKIFQKMCVNLDDMKQYILEFVQNRGLDESTLTVSHLSSAIAFYYLEMEAHYFSFSEEDTGIPPGPLSMIEWEVAKYECSNLPQDRIFRYYND